MRFVYSTNGAHANLCPTCGKDPCVCEVEAGAAPRQQSPRVRREKQGRGGKTVTVVYDLELTDSELKSLGKELRQSCASGGTVKEGRIEIRGDHRDRVVELLTKKGFRARAAGG